MNLRNMELAVNRKAASRSGSRQPAPTGQTASMRALGYWPRREPFHPRYASFLRTVPRGGVIREGRVNPMQLAGLDGPLAQLISPCTEPARLDASQDRRFRHADSFRGLPEGVTHVLLSVP